MTLPPIPDNIHKFFLFAGIIILAYAYFEGEKNSDKYISKIEIFNSSIDSLDIQLMQINHQKDYIMGVADVISRRNNVENPISNHDSVIRFEQIISGAKAQVSVSDSLSKMWHEYKENKFRIAVYEKQLEMRKKALADAELEYKEMSRAIIWIYLTGALFSVMGFAGMRTQQTYQDELLKRQLSEKGAIYKFCQSCGKKFSSMRSKGKNKDGTNNSAFCSDCFEHGQFIEPDLTIDEFTIRVKSEVDKRKTWLGKKLLAARLKSLERWDADHYF